MPYQFTDRTKASEAGKKSRRGSAKRSQEWEMLRKAIMQKHTKRFNKILNELPPEVFVKTYLEILKYFRPRLQNITVEPVPPPPEPRPYRYMQLQEMSLEQLEAEIETLKQLENGQKDIDTAGDKEAQGRN